MNSQNSQLNVILLIVFMGFVGTSIAYPIFSPLFLHPKIGSIIPYSWDLSTRSIFLGLALSAYPLGQFVGAPIFGSCSDRYGRKKMLVLSLSGSTLGYFFTALSLQLNALYLLLWCRFLTGFLEANFPVAQAMATDLESINKYKSLGKLSGAAAMGYVVGPLLGGFLASTQGFSWSSYSIPFLVAAVLSGKRSDNPRLSNYSAFL